MHIYMIGICGTAMGNLALLLRQLGHQVSGSDREAFPPMSDFLIANNIRIDDWKQTPIPPGTELVIVGNAVSRGQPQAEQLLREKYPMLSMPAAISRFLLPQRHVAVVAGTHGKTTTTALLAHILRHSGRDCGFLIGGLARNLGRGAELGSDPIFVIEGDEYDSAFFDKRSKFIHYHPDTLLLNNLEFDHADIFADMEALRRSFRHLLAIVPDNGRIIYNAGDNELQRLVGAAFTPPTACRLGGEGATFIWQRQAGESLLKDEAGRFTLARLWGRHNAANAMLAIAAARHLGVNDRAIAAATASFAGVERRLQEIARWPGDIILFEDFAHHPTAISATLTALRQQFPNQRLVAVVEPRSNTMARGFHQDTLPQALAVADVVYLARPHRYEQLPKEQRLDREKVLRQVAAGGREVRHEADGAAILAALRQSSRAGDRIVIMSNGSFSGLRSELAGQ
jgi:UDP-N-acetylmuramate: L-alanyl-gamma-D-glutamyl-meso-diaminopimelate ligase